MVVDAGGLDPDFGREIAEIQAAIAVRLRGPLCCRQDGLPSA